ncbi:MAG: hypothetical protein QXR03_03015 [Candidatus Aenigmatarchaeota archaeon]
MKIKKAINFIRETIEENKSNAMNLLSLGVIAMHQGLEAIANTLQGLFVGITLLCWAFVGIKLLSGYGLISLPFASRSMKEKGHREAEESVGISLLIAIGVTLITIIISLLQSGFPQAQAPQYSK